MLLVSKQVGTIIIGPSWTLIFFITTKSNYENTVNRDVTTIASDWITTTVLMVINSSKRMYFDLSRFRISFGLAVKAVASLACCGFDSHTG